MCYFFAQNLTLEMACLRSLSRRSHYPKWFCCKTSRPDVLHHHIKDYTESSFKDSSFLIRSFHRHDFFEDRKKISSAQPVGSSGVLLCRHMSSKPDESYSKIDAFGNVVEELVSEKSVEAMATKFPTIDGCTAAVENFSFPGDFVHYVINGIHELTGFNWWMSIVLTAFLVNVMMSPVSMRVQRRAWEIQILLKAMLKVEHFIQAAGDHPKALAKYKKWEAELMEKFEDVALYLLTLFALDAFIYICFIDGITTMAKKIPELSTSYNIYILPLVTGFTFWLSSEINTSRTNILSRMKRLPLFPIIFIALQATFEFEPAVYFYVIPSRIYISTLYLMLGSNQIVKLRSFLGWPDVPVTTVSEQQRIMRRLISLMREFIDVVKKKNNK